MKVRPKKEKIVYNDGDFIFTNDKIYEAFFSVDARHYIIKCSEDKEYFHIHPLEFLEKFEVVNTCIDCGKEFTSNEFHLRCEECKDEAFSEYCKEVSMSYWSEEDEIKQGIHPLQLN